MIRSSFFAMTFVACAALSGCIDRDYKFEGTEAPIDSSTGETATDTAMPDSGDGKCRNDGDCGGNLATPLCNTTTGKCVECLDDSRCGAKTYCNAEGACVDGCKNDTDCPAPTGDAGVDADDPDAKVVGLSCDTSIHMCVGCKADSNCPDGFLCTVADGICRPGCTEAHGCPTGRDCCSGKCLDTAKEVTNCGGCGVACPTPANTTMKCERDTTTGKGVCKVGSCAAGWADCNSSTAGGAADGCEQDIFTKLDNCGGCGTACTIANGTGVCEGGVCKVATCSTGFGNCDGIHTNGCEQELKTVAHCGACNTACAPANAAGDCSDGTCKIGSCNTGYGNCDVSSGGGHGNGCETNLKTDANNCNACGTVCPSTGGTPACVAGVCKFSSCAAGTGDCDGSGTCSFTLSNNVNHCGACGRACVAANGTPQCVGTACSIASCTTGFADCNTSYIDGCEQKLDTLTHCGGCNTACSRTNATATCATGSCKINTCQPNFGNCDGIDSNGCEKSLVNDINNCGACSKVCNVTNGTGTCSGTTCAVASCNAGYANCDSNAADCERAFGTAANTCATAESITDSSGSPDFCGTNAPETKSVTTTSTKYYKVHLIRCDTGSCKSSDHMRVRVSLANPSGVSYDLRVFDTSACSGTPLGSSTSGTPGATETVSYNAGNCTTPRDVWIEVKYRSGSSCTPSTLTIASAY